ncbi:MAG: alanine--tRNA ligase [Candidatus Aenigmatarchaeota archaeon]
MAQENAKQVLKQKFGKDFRKYYWMPLFDEHGYKRKKCSKCGNFFWTTKGTDICPSPPCTTYGFIGSRQKPMDYIETWKAIEKFFVKNEHTSVPSYPVIARWFPGMYFTLASIVAFQRSIHGKTVFEMPYEKIIIPQVCLRFNDIPNVGVTGRHMSNFIMVGQHTIHEPPRGYWKEKCVELDYELLTKVFGIKPADIDWVEDVWVGPNAFGYSLEYYTKGLELGNAVFTEFVGTPNNYKQMDQRVIDMGAGLERFCWFTNGTATAYDAVYGPVVDKMKKLVDYDKKLFGEYAKIASSLDMDEVSDINKERAHIAEQLNVDVNELKRHVEPLEAIYAIADHSKTLLYAITDGGMPSNIGGGYNLRVILRRALAFIDKFKLDIELSRVCEWHANYLKKLTPKLKENLNEVTEILNVEEERYFKSKHRARAIVEKMIKNREEIDDEKFVQLYESSGVTPELVDETAQTFDVKISIPQDFYVKLSARHMKEKEESTHAIELDLKNLQPTTLAFRDNDKLRKLDAKVLRYTNGWLILDKTIFYAEAGGQDHDLGKINNIDVEDVQKFGDTIAHKITGKWKNGQNVDCEIDWNRRTQLTQHHSAVHLINAAARQLLGNHVWQGGSGKSVEKAHLDITHYSSLSEKQVDELEELANKFIKDGLTFEKKNMSRQEAEARYSMRLYQGGAVPEKELRTVVIVDRNKVMDAEACGGTHVDNSKEIGEIVVTNVERIQDGLVRITLVAGKAAEYYRDDERKIVLNCMKILGCKESNLVKKTDELFEKWKSLQKKIEEEAKTRGEKVAKELGKGDIIVRQLDLNVSELKAITKDVGARVMVLFGNDNSVVAASGTKLDVGKFLHKLCKELGGGGGGSHAFAQGVYKKKPDVDKICKELEDVKK